MKTLKKLDDDIVVNKCSKENSKSNVKGKLLIPLLYIIVAIMFGCLLWKTYSAFM